METYTVKEAAEILGMSTVNVRNWIYSGKIKAEKDENGLYQIEKETIDFLLIKDEKPKKITDPRPELIAHIEEIRNDYKKQILDNPQYKHLVDAMNERIKDTKGISYDWNTCYTNFYNHTWEVMKEDIRNALKLTFKKKKKKRKKYNRHNGRMLTKSS